MNLELLQSQKLQDNLEILEIRSHHELGQFASQILEKSHQPHIKEFESEDTMPGGRFSSEHNLHEWMNIERIVYPLIDIRQNDLAGISWYSPRQYPREGSTRNLADYNITFGIRLYEGYVGKKLALPYMQTTQRMLGKIAKGRGLWLSAKKQNSRAISVYRKAGYRYDYEDDEQVYMTNDDALVL